MLTVKRSRAGCAALGYALWAATMFIAVGGCATSAGRGERTETVQPLCLRIEADVARGAGPRQLDLHVVLFNDSDAPVALNRVAASSWLGTGGFVQTYAQLNGQFILDPEPIAENWPSGHTELLAPKRLRVPPDPPSVPAQGTYDVTTVPFSAGRPGAYRVWCTLFLPGDEVGWEYKPSSGESTLRWEGTTLKSNVIQFRVREDGSLVLGDETM